MTEVRMNKALSRFERGNAEKMARTLAEIRHKLAASAELVEGEQVSLMVAENLLRLATPRQLWDAIFAAKQEVGDPAVTDQTESGAS